MDNRPNVSGSSSLYSAMGMSNTIYASRKYVSALMDLYPVLNKTT